MHPNDTICFLRSHSLAKIYSPSLNIYKYSILLKGIIKYDDSE